MFQYKDHLSVYRDSCIKIRRLWDPLIFIMVIPLLMTFTLKWSPGMPSCNQVSAINLMIRNLLLKCLILKWVAVVWLKYRTLGKYSHWFHLGDMPYRYIFKKLYVSCSWSPNLPLRVISTNINFANIQPHIYIMFQKQILPGQTPDTLAISSMGFTLIRNIIFGLHKIT